MNETDIPIEFRPVTLSQLNQSEDDNKKGSEASSDCAAANFCKLDEDDVSPDAVYVDLMKNPERFTGYSGDSANRVWRSIYEENCFGGVKYIEPVKPKTQGGAGFVDKGQIAKLTNAPVLVANSPFTPAPEWNSMLDSVQSPVDAATTEQCLEKRVFYRVISGLHASISIHICNEYLDANTGEWAPNLECFISRISQHPERLQNVYFNYVLILRALAKAGEFIDNFGLLPGDEIRDPETKKQLADLLHAAQQSQPSFDEHKLFQIQNNAEKDAQTLALKEDFRQHFMNISRIMDCVGCDKCRLWGKVQVTGVGTALKLLFSFDADKPDNKVIIRRSELVALINTAHRFSESLNSLSTFRDMYQARRAVSKGYSTKESSTSATSPSQLKLDDLLASFSKYYLATVEYCYNIILSTTITARNALDYVASLFSVNFRAAGVHTEL
ncbi:endoplasmic oxidoreductin-1 [Malassezia cuniculi]|uniref:Endoplasmic oxidoreductin-1 n=1 Tax=Malassezia cuniculi TaxID=948313 RepID=A0AAF0F1U0_9BASI|nr:endoplasmic oxidoreductin-1 [Malassezia cuniculi]